MTKLKAANTVTRTLPALLICTTLSVAGCASISQSRLNPLNWFGSSEAVPLTNLQELRPLVTPGTVIGPVDARQAVATIQDLRIDRTPDGAIVVATGITATAGPFNAELVEVGNAGGVLTFAFRAETGGTAPTRQVTAAAALGRSDLAGVSQIRVQAAGNALAVSR